MHGVKYNLLRQYREGAYFAPGLFWLRKFRHGLILHAVPYFLWDILHPHAVSLPLARLDLNYILAFSLFVDRRVARGSERLLLILGGLL